MQNEIFRCDVSFIFERDLRKGRRARRTRECVYFKVEIVEMPGARPPLWPRRRIYAPMMSSDSRVFGEGRRSTPTHADHHTAVTASNCLSSALGVWKYCLSLLALKPLLRVISIVSSVRRAFYPSPSSSSSSSPPYVHTVSHRFHSASNTSLFFPLLVLSLRSSPWDELQRAPRCLFNCGSIRLRSTERMRPLIYPDGLMVEVWGWPAHCGNTALAFLGIVDRFQDPLLPPPRHPFHPLLCSLQLCLLWMACLIIYRKGKGSSWSNKHVTALYFVFHWEGRVL